MSAFSRVGMERSASSSSAAGRMEIDTGSEGRGFPAPAHAYQPPPSPSSSHFEISSSLGSPPSLHNRPQSFRRYNSDSSSSSGGAGAGAGAFQPFLNARRPAARSAGSVFDDSLGVNSNSLSGLGASSSSASSAVYSDRFIPSRNASDLEGAFDYVDYGGSDSASAGDFENGGGAVSSSAGSSHGTGTGTGAVGIGMSDYSYAYGAPRSEASRESQDIINTLLRGELLGMSQLQVGSGYGSPSGGAAAAAAAAAAGGSGYSSFEGGQLGGPGGADHLRSSLESRSSAGSGGGFTGQNVLRFRSDRRRSSGDSASISSNNSAGSGDSGSVGGSNGGLLAVGGFGGSVPGSPSMLGSQGQIGSPLRKAPRKISKVPYKMLDAPALQDDYYLNLVDWSSTNVISVALGCRVYLWSGFTTKVTELCDTGVENVVTSTCWSPGGTHLAVGTNNGRVQIWDVQESKLVRNMNSHSSRVGTMAWSSTLLATGSRDRTILLQDARIRGGGGGGGGGNGNGNGSGAESAFTVGPTNNRDSCVVHELIGHKQEVCGLKWSPDEKMLASGGNDNKLFVWALNHAEPSTPVCRFSDHCAAVKAVAWSPHQSGLLASGGGTADRNIRFWNALTGVPLHRVDTGSQVCNLMWSKTVNEIVSTHGYSLNQVIVWKYPSMQKVATLTGHTMRVLYLAMSPDGQSVVTGAGDETLRFWNLFPGARALSGTRGSGLLFPGADIR